MIGSLVGGEERRAEAAPNAARLEEEEDSEDSEVVDALMAVEVRWLSGWCNTWSRPGALRDNTVRPIRVVQI